MLFDLIGMILIVAAIKLNLSEECPFTHASTDSCSPASATDINDTDVELKLTHNISIRTNDLRIETKIFSHI